MVNINNETGATVPTLVDTNHFINTGQIRQRNQDLNSMTRDQLLDVLRNINNDINPNNNNPNMNVKGVIFQRKLESV